MALSTFNTFNAWGSIARSSPPTIPGKPVFTSATTTTLTYSFDQSVGSMPITYSAFLSSVALSGGQSGTGNPTSYTISGLVSNTSYKVGMKATNFVATSNQSPTTDMLTVPSAPTSVIASTDNTNTQGASITFTAPTGNGTITSYTITSTPTATLTYSGTTSPISISSGLTSNTSYTFTITATNNSGTSAPSASASAYTYPNNPTSLVITPRSGDFTFSYAAPTTGTITGYNVYINSVIVSSNLTTTTYMATSLTADTLYTYKLSALNGTRESSGLSGNQGTLPSTAPTITTVLSSPDTSTKVDATVTYTRNANLTYTYYVTSTPGLKSASATATADSTVLTVAGLTPLTSYTFIAYCNNGFGSSPNSTNSSAITTGPPIPTNLSVTVSSDTAVSITFSLPTFGSAATISSYKYTATAQSGPGTNVNGTATGTASPITITGLIGSTSYLFKIASATSSLTSNYSNNQATPAVTNFTISAIVSGTTAIITTTTNSSLFSTYAVTSNPVTTSGSGTTSPLILTGLTSGTSYTFKVTGTYIAGGSLISANTGSFTPSSIANPTGAINGITTGPTYLFTFTTSTPAVTLANTGSVGGTATAPNITTTDTLVVKDASSTAFIYAATNGFLGAGIKPNRGSIRWSKWNSSYGSSLSNIVLPNSTMTVSNTGATICFYTYFEGFNTSNLGIIFTAGTVAAGNLLQISISGSSPYNGTYYVSVNNSGYGTTYTTSGGAWEHVAFVFNPTGNNVNVYINGVFKEYISPGAWTYSSSLSPATIGPTVQGSSTTNNMIYGQLYDFRIYNYPLTAAQVAAVHYNP